MSGSATTRVFTFDAVTTDYSFIEPQVLLFRDSDMVESAHVTSAVAAESTLATGEDAIAAADEEETVTEVSFTVSVKFASELFEYHVRP